MKCSRFFLPYFHILTHSNPNHYTVILVLFQYLFTKNNTINITISDIMNIKKEYNEKELTLSVEGRIDTLTSQDLEKEITAEMGNFDSLIIDFKDLEYISSAGLRVLIATQKQLKEKDIPLTIRNVNDTVGEIFRMSGFDKILKIE